MLTLRPYQTQALAAVEAAYPKITRPLMVAATGTGKTVVFAHLLRKRGGRAIVLVHRDELARQAVEKLSDVGLQAGIVKAEQDDCDKQVTVASVQTVRNLVRLAKITDYGVPRTVVVDEAHHATADSYKAVLTALGAFQRPDLLTLGVTATPFRGDASDGLGDVWEQVVHTYSLRDAITEGYLAPIKALSVCLKADFKKLKTVHGDISEASAEKVLLAANAPQVIAKAVKDHASDRKSLIFAPTVKVATLIEEACAAVGLSAASIFGETPQDLRRETLLKFRNNGLQALVNCGVLTEGYDESSVSCVVMARPTKSKVLYVQCIGRGTRLHPGKTDLLILDIVGAVHRHDLLTAAAILPTTAKKLTFADRLAGTPIGEKEEPHGKISGVTVEEVDIWGCRPFAWIKCSFGYVLDLGREHGWVTMRQREYGWEVGRLRGEAFEVVWKGVQFGYAQGVAEQYVKNLGAEALATRDAGWRRAPMTAGQKWMLERWGVAFSHKWNKGLASDGITRAIAEAKFRRHA